MYRTLLAQLETFADSLEDCEPATDQEALLRVYLARTLAKAITILRALAADEKG